MIESFSGENNVLDLLAYVIIVENLENNLVINAEVPHLGNVNEKAIWVLKVAVFTSNLGQGKLWRIAGPPVLGL